MPKLYRHAFDFCTQKPLAMLALLLLLGVFDRLLAVLSVAFFVLIQYSSVFIVGLLALQYLAPVMSALFKAVVLVKLFRWMLGSEPLWTRQVPWQGIVLATLIFLLPASWSLLGAMALMGNSLALILVPPTWSLVLLALGPLLGAFSLGASPAQAVNAWRQDFHRWPLLWAIGPVLGTCVINLALNASVLLLTPVLLGPKPEIFNFIVSMASQSLATLPLLLTAGALTSLEEDA